MSDISCNFGYGQNFSAWSSTNRTVYICPDKTKNELGVLQYMNMQLSKSRNKCRFCFIQVTSYGGYLSFTLETVVALDGGQTFRDVDIEIIVGFPRNVKHAQHS